MFNYKKNQTLRPPPGFALSDLYDKVKQNFPQLVNMFVELLVVKCRHFFILFGLCPGLQAYFFFNRVPVHTGQPRGLKFVNTLRNF